LGFGIELTVNLDVSGALDIHGVDALVDVNI
jgi:hypothetical protein